MLNILIMPVYNLIENSDNYSKKSGSLKQYYKDSLANSKSFKSKVKNSTRLVFR